MMLWSISWFYGQHLNSKSGVCSPGSQECRGQMIPQYDGGVPKENTKSMGKQEKREAEAEKYFVLRWTQKLTVYIHRF